MTYILCEEMQILWIIFWKNKSHIYHDNKKYSYIKIAET